MKKDLLLMPTHPLSGEQLEAISFAITQISSDVARPTFNKFHSDSEFAQDNTDLKDDGKGGKEFVTIVDQQINEQLSERLQEIVPRCLILSEEGTKNRPYQEYVDASWEAPVFILDPLDGTQRFVEGEKNFTTGLALMYKGEVISSWIHLPMYGEDEKYGETFHSYKKGHLEKYHPTGENVNLLGADFERKENTKLAMDANESMEKMVKETRCDITVGKMGSRLFAYVALLKGDIDATLFLKEPMNIWDHAAGLLLALRAGGAFVQTSEDSPFNSGQQGLLTAISPEILGQIHHGIGKPLHEKKRLALDNIPFTIS